MKRSEINKALKDMHDLIKKFHVSLPPFCEWTPEEWKTKGKEYDEIRDNMLGWDITDFGLGDFEHTGFSLITLRNGNIKNDKYDKPYAEKLLMLHEGQHAEMHYHAYKMEDIINRGGGNVLIRVYNSTEDGKEPGTGPVLIGEVSQCNDDNTDNYFYNKKVGRFPAIDEDEEPYRLLCNEYPEVL